MANLKKLLFGGALALGLYQNADALDSEKFINTQHRLELYTSKPNNPEDTKKVADITITINQYGKTNRYVGWAKIDLTNWMKMFVNHISYMTEFVRKDDKYVVDRIERGYAFLGTYHREEFLYNSDKKTLQYTKKENRNTEEEREVVFTNHPNEFFSAYLNGIDKVFGEICDGCSFSLNGMPPDWKSAELRFKQATGGWKVNINFDSAFSTKYKLENIVVDIGEDLLLKELKADLNNTEKNKVKYHILLRKN